jgi:hypothetical protein
MATRFIAALAFGVAAVAACDVSQKTPQTVVPAVVLSPLAPAGTVAIGRDAQSTTDSPSHARTGATIGERSLRLYGPGVSRKRQTRV